MSDLNIPLIKKNIKEQHEKFIKKVGKMPEKISADEKLKITKFVARLETIFKLFAEEGVIDCVKKYDNGSSVLMILSKNICNEKVSVIVSAKAIFMRFDDKELGNSNLNLNSRIGQYKAEEELDFETFDWEDFSKRLLGIIHEKMYNSIKSYEMTIFN